MGNNSKKVTLLYLGDTHLTATPNDRLVGFHHGDGLHTFFKISQGAIYPVTVEYAYQELQSLNLKATNWFRNKIYPCEVCGREGSYALHATWCPKYV